MICWLRPGNGRDCKAMGYGLWALDYGLWAMDLWRPPLRSTLGGHERSGLSETLRLIQLLHYVFMALLYLN